MIDACVVGDESWLQRSKRGDRWLSILDLVSNWRDQCLRCMSSWRVMMQGDGKYLKEYIGDKIIEKWLVIIC